MPPLVSCTFLGMATDTEWKKRIGQRIQEIRESKGWSLTDLARLTGDRLQKSQISNYEQGTRMPGLGKVEILAETLGETPAHILCLDDDDMATPNKKKLTDEAFEVALMFMDLNQKERARFKRDIMVEHLNHVEGAPDGTKRRTGDKITTVRSKAQ